MFWAVELVRDRGTREMLVPYAASGAQTRPVDEVVAACKERGMWPVYNFNRIHVVPPCTITDEEARQGLEILDEALNAADRHVNGRPLSTACPATPAERYPMRAVVVLTVTECPDPVPGPGELVVRVAAAGVNYKDVYEREGRSPLAAPLVPGSEGAGTVLSVGPGADTFAPGDRVAWWSAPGSYAEQAVVPVRAAVRLPADITEQAAAAVLPQGLTAQYLTTSSYPVIAGEAALVPTAAGGLGQQLVRVLPRRGVHVVGTVSTETKARIARAAGARDVLVLPPGSGNRPAELAARIRELTGGRGVEVVFDGVGKDTFELGLASLRRRGTFVLVGAASGPVPPFDPQRLAAAGSLFLTRPTLVDHATAPEELATRAAEVFAWLRDGTLTATHTTHYPLAQAAQAQTDLQGRRTTGKLLLIP